MKDISHAELINRVHYDATSGEFRWKTHQRTYLVGKRAECNHSKRYLGFSINGQKYFAHRLAWFYVYGKWPVEQIDHINGVRHDNRLLNLREASCKQNVANRPAFGRSGIKGVYSVGIKFRARIMIERRHVSLGTFDTVEEAYLAYQNASVKVHGSYCLSLSREVNHV